MRHCASNKLVIQKNAAAAPPEGGPGPQPHLQGPGGPQCAHRHRHQPALRRITQGAGISRQGRQVRLLHRAAPHLPGGLHHERQRGGASPGPGLQVR